MNLETKRKGDILIAQVNGEIDHHTSAELRYMLDMEIVNSGINTLIIDLAGVKFMDSSGIGVIMGRKKNMSLLGGRTCVSGVRDSVKKLMEITGFNGVIDFYSDVNSAVEAMR